MGVIIQEVCGTEQDGLFFHLFGRGPLDQLLPHRRRTPGRRRLQHRHGPGQTGRRRRTRCASRPATRRRCSRPRRLNCAARHAERGAQPRASGPRSSRVDRRRGEPAPAGLTRIGGLRNAKFICSVWDRENERHLRDSPFDRGARSSRSTTSLKYNTFPLAEIISTSSRWAPREMRCPVEVEFAVNMDVAPDSGRFSACCRSVRSSTTRTTGPSTGTRSTPPAR